VQAWNYKTEGAYMHRLGPVAQAFHAVFDLGADNRYIATVDADGVALAAIQELNQKLEQKPAELSILQKRVEQLAKLVDTLRYAKN
jgi:hypothetical protein